MTINEKMASYDVNRKYIAALKKLYVEMGKTKTLDRKIEILKEVYEFIKEVSMNFYDEGMMSFNYYFLRDLILLCEQLLPTEYILNFQANFVLDERYYRVQNQSQDPEEILKYIVFYVRNVLYQEASMTEGKDVPFSQFDLTNFCHFASYFVMLVCQNLHLSAQTVKIEPGFMKDSPLYNGHGYHFFNIVTIKGQKYLVDCTYSQFFLLNHNLKERMGIVNISGCEAGIFMINDMARKKVAQKILEDGYILLTDDVLKMYLDGFAISYRNGLYYEETNDFSYTTNYTAQDYHNFLAGVDNQANHENILSLGYQRSPLKNPYLHF